jgi:outer membrane receptor protein involved in Fe transport
VGEITSADAIALLYGVPGQDRAPLGGVPPAKGTFSVRWNDPGSRGFLEAGSRWSWRTNRLPLPTPGVGQLTAFKKEWIVADITAGVRFTQRLRATLGVRNVTDRTYRQPLGSLDEPGRSFFMTLSSDY